MTGDGPEFRAKTTVCTPSFVMTRGNSRAATAIGMAIFIGGFLVFLLVVAVAFLVFTSSVSPILRDLFICVLILLTALMFIGILIIDILSSIEQSSAQAADYLRQVENRLYQLYLLESKRNKKK